ncbi:MAG TPA: hypothetical protein VG916_05550 [Gemmatimonadaceae bacterium]|nr:hypothetical protein [Gemmatimonadaceae bacterium]
MPVTLPSALRPFRPLAAAVLALGGFACGRADATPGRNDPPATTAAARTDSIARARQDSINRAQPGYVVDSVFPIAEEVRRFRAAIGGTPVTSLTAGETSRESLVRAVVAAAVAGDSAALVRLALTAREFADLVYPASPFARAPSQESPARVWMTIQNPSVSGRLRLVRRLGGLALAYVSHQCDAAPEHQGPNVLWTRCVVTLAAANGARETHRLFGTILERDGHFKVVSYTNEF